MATIKELYDKNKDLSQKQGGPEAASVDANLAIDQIPYSAGENINGGKAADVGAIDKAADFSVISPGNRYGFQGADIGAGISEYKTILGPGGIGSLQRESWNDTKKYGGINREAN
jgi:hypothetical protein